jgi:arylsulfatase A-like enzyme
MDAAEDEATRQEMVCTSNGQQFGLYTTRMIRDKRYKYVWNLTDVDEFYDLEEDPKEFENRYEDPRYADIIAELTQLLEAEPHLMDTVFRTPDGEDYWLNYGNGAGFAANGEMG